MRLYSFEEKTVATRSNVVRMPISLYSEGSEYEQEDYVLFPGSAMAEAEALSLLEVSA